MWEETSNKGKQHTWHELQQTTNIQEYSAKLDVPPPQPLSSILPHVDLNSTSLKLIEDKAKEVQIVYDCVK